MFAQLPGFCLYRRLHSWELISGSIAHLELILNGYSRKATVSSISMCRLRVQVNQMKMAYLIYTRPILKCTCPVLGRQIHNIEYQSDDVEGAKKRAAKIILEETFVSYKFALESLKIETLTDLRF